MFIIRSKAFLFLLGGFICLIPTKRIPLTAMVFEHDESFISSLPEKNSGYKDIVAYEDQFLAVGTNGRIDRINRSGEITPITNTYDVHLNGVINDIVYDSVGDQFLLACNNGEVVNLPSCTKCNKSLTVTGKDLHGIICSKNILMIVGDDYYVNTINLR